MGGAIILLTILCTYEMSKLKIGDPTPGSPIFYDNHRYNRDQAAINSKFDASSENLMLFYEGQKESVYDPAVLHTFEAFDRSHENGLARHLQVFLLDHRHGEDDQRHLP